MSKIETDTIANSDITNKDLSQIDIETKLKESFTGISASNITILAHYMYKNKKKWSADSKNFITDVNKLIPEAYAYNMKTSNVLFGSIITICIILLIGLIWWVISIFIKKNKKNILDDPIIVNPVYI